MHHPLPRSVRRKIADITQNVSHETSWAYHTQVAFPGECQWRVTGGHDWPLSLWQVEVSVTSTASNKKDNLRVVGLEAVEVSLAANRAARETVEGCGDVVLQNEGDALRQVLGILKVAQKVKEELLM